MGTKAQTEDDFGSNLIAVEEPDVNIRAKIRPEMLTEEEQNQQLKAVTKIKLWVRYNPLWTTEKLIFWDDKYYELIAPPELFMGAKIFQVLKARLIET